MQLKNKLKKVNFAAELMPKDKITAKILHDRAENIAQLKQPSQNQAQSEDYILIGVGNEFYGIPYQYTEEVLSHNNITKIPTSQSFIAGIINHRGNLLTIIDLANFLSGESIELNISDASIIVVAASEITIGLLVDSIICSNTYEKEKLENSLSTDTHYIKGLDKGQYAIIQIETLLADIKKKCEI